MKQVHKIKPLRDIKLNLTRESYAYNGSGIRQSTTTNPITTGYFNKYILLVKMMREVTINRIT